MTSPPAPSKILIVDDSLTNIELLVSILGNDHELSFATSGSDALEQVAQYPVDLILLDVVMPGVDGFEVCRRLKSDPATRDVPIIFLTSLDSAVDEERGLTLGAEDFIHKPVSPPVVRARVRTHLQLAQAKQELKRHNDHLESLVAERTRDVMHRDQQLIASQGATITAFCALAEARDNETGNHIRRTQNYVRALAEELSDHPRYRQRLKPAFIQTLFKSAPLHDVGKVAIPDAILLKPGKLTDSEWLVMKRHCGYGYKAIVTAARELTDDDGAFLGCAADIAYGHHERWDGTGYPRQLQGDAIPLSARLMAVADVYDALTTRRVYKTAYPHDRSIRSMVLERGTHFDPDVIDALVRVADQFAAIAAQYRDDDYPWAQSDDDGTV
jgi:putative two-component system response regulator